MSSFSRGEDESESEKDIPTWHKRNVLFNDRLITN